MSICDAFVSININKSPASHISIHAFQVNLSIFLGYIINGLDEEMDLNENYRYQRYQLNCDEINNQL